MLSPLDLCNTPTKNKVLVTDSLTVQSVEHKKSSELDRFKERPPKNIVAQAVKTNQRTGEKTKLSEGGRRE